MHIEEVQVKHKLVDAEIAQMAREQSVALQERHALEDELISVRKDYAARQAMADAKVTSMASRIQSGFEFRNVRCLLMDERIEGYRLTIRMDNGHCHKRRKLEQHERQQTLTSEAPREFVATAMLTVDDEQWDTEFVQVGLYEDEFEALRTITDVKCGPAPKPHKRLMDGKDKPKK